jgi:DNA polymerase epsilon subunit 3
MKMQQDVVLALLRSSTLFIGYLSELLFRFKLTRQLLRTLLVISQADCSAHDQALSRSGKSITASDIIKAIMEMDFGPADNLVPLLEQELAGGLSRRVNGLMNQSTEPTSKLPRQKLNL